MIVEPHLDEKPKYVIIWVPNSDKYNATVNESLKHIIAENHKNKIKTVIFRSGTKSLPEQTSMLLDHYAKKYGRDKEIDSKSIDLFTNLWYNILVSRNNRKDH